MKNKKPNAEHLWKQFEDLLVPHLRLSVIERAVYSHLLRHGRVQLGRNSYRNLVSCCLECNSLPPAPFAPAELTDRLRALAGKLRPTIAPIAHPLRRMGRPHFTPQTLSGICRGGHSTGPCPSPGK